MSTIGNPVQRRLRTLIAIGAIALALAFPSAAFAATASFSSRTPGSGSSTTDTQPTISVKAYDRYGIRGSGSKYMSIDRVPVKITSSYIASGGWDPRHPDYRRVKLSYKPTTALSAGTHRVFVRVKDRRGYTSSTTWYFTVDAPEGPYAATFSNPSPANLSNSTVATPTISVSGYDKYGITGALSFSIKLDGNTVPASIRYAKSGVFTSFTLSYKVPSPLTAGSHTVVASVTDTHSNVSTYSWTFIVPQQVIVYEDMPYAGTTCGDCHAGYPATHPMTNCKACHGSGRPVTGTAYSSSSTSAHTLSCATMTCHRGPGLAFPHVLGACSDCHDGSYSGIPASHSLDVPSLHEAPAAFCIAQGCHVSSLTKEHYRYTSSGARLSCATCHASANTSVQAAIAAGSTSCTSCHDLSKFTHPGTSVAHAATNTCVRSACHVSDVTSIHKGNCSACHAPGKTASTQCTTCHASGAYHANMAGKHAIANGCTSGAGCHTAGDLSLIHVKDNVQHCEACHAEGTTPSSDCISCHGSELLAKHSNAGAKHTGPAIDCTTSACHGADVTNIHKTGDTFNCTACHKSDGSTPTTTCSTCHTGNVTTVHSTADLKHAAPAVFCIGSGCHETNVSLIHVKNGVSNCYACHATGTAPIKQCDQCHPGDISIVHAASTPKHVATLITCVSATCHGTDVSAFHLKDNGDKNCAACHGGSTPPTTTTCTACHASDVAAVHAKADPLHAPPSTFCQNVCHPRSVGLIHKDSSLGCAACHSGPTAPATTDCLECHPGTVQTFHAAASVAHLAQSGTCVAGGICHTANVLAYHDPDGSGQGCWKCHDSAHSALLDPEITCSKCHAGDVSMIHPDLSMSHAAPVGITCVAAPCHQDNVMTIHDAAGTGIGCAACHDGSKRPSTQCSDCHSTDFSIVHDRGAAPHMIGAGHGCSNSTCHPSQNVAVIHQAAVENCSACHAPGETAIKVCSTCHAPDTIPGRHSSASALHQATLTTCVKSGCHVTDVMAVHQNGPGCIACHGEGITPTLVCTTSGCHSSNIDTLHDHGTVPHTTTSGYCVRAGCHGGFVTEIHNPDGEGPGCAACHDNPDHELTAVCTTCHGPSQAIVHAKADAIHTVPQTTCAGYAAGSPCHVARVDDVHRKASVGCMACHDKQTTPSTVCATCHTGTLTPTHASAESSHTTDPQNKCTGAMCHGTNVLNIHAGTTKSCLACHGPDAPAVTTDCTTCHTPHNLPALHASSPASQEITISGVSYGVHACSECHAADLRYIHGGSQNCPTCHTSKIGALVGGTWAKGCVQGGCHTADSTKPMHATVTSAHMLTSTPTCLAAGCHEGGNDVVKIHAPALGCATCHGSGKTPTLVCATSGCHETGAPTTHASHESTMSAAVISINGTAYGTHSCSDCHGASFELQEIHGGSSSCSKCHGGPADTAPAGYFACDQANCHVVGSAYTVPLHFTINADHTLSSAPTCVVSGCHTGGTDLAKIHAPALGCATCHGSGKTPTAVCATAGCHPTGAPSTHASHVSTVTAEVISINGVDYGSHACSDCHSPLDLQPIHGGAASCGTCHPGAADATTGSNGFACAQSGCHVPGSPYAGAVHAAINSAHTLGSAPSCIGAGCHSGGTDVAVIHAPKLGCATCHGAGKTPTLDCNATGCHATTASSHSSHASTQTAGSITINGTAYGVTCSQCHSGMDLQVLHGGSSSCAKCHPSPASTAAVGSFACVQGGCHTSNTGNMQKLHETASTDHALATQPSCIGASCHQGGQDAARIHSYATVGCGACHGSGKTPSLDCAACHGTTTGDHTSSHAECNTCHKSGDPGWSCSDTGDCHGTDHWNGPIIGAENCTACHTGAPTWTHPGVGGNCGCHGDEGIGTWTMVW